MRTWNSLKKEWLKDPAFKKEYDKLEGRYALIDKVIGERIKRKLTQAQLAKKAGTKQSAIARLESGNVNPSLNFMEKIATALEMRLNIEFR
ncbi:MAG: helix-turn-helix domain-containing protein [Microgenomates group bacterium Gr01-1014_16]|nr:MAG: helix-turn-helix domain-containing protein [Microgenomates group bacterium Gr01-1014_16]